MNRTISSVPLPKKASILLVQILAIHIFAPHAISQERFKVEVVPQLSPSRMCALPSWQKFAARRPPAGRLRSEHDEDAPASSTTSSR